MLCSNLIVQRFKRNVIIALVLVFYATNVLSRSDQIAKNAIEPGKSSNTTKQVPFEEYYIEHNVSEGDARRSFREVGIKLIEGMWYCQCSKCIQLLQDEISLLMICDCVSVSVSGVYR